APRPRSPRTAVLHSRPAPIGTAWLHGDAMKANWARLLVLPIMAVLAACAPGAGPGQSGPAPAESSPAQPQRTMQVAIRLEPASLGTRALVQAGVALYLSKRMFNAELSILDPDANPHPYLAESLPQLSTDDWRVMPDGRME